MHIWEQSVKETQILRDCAEKNLSRKNYSYCYGELDDSRTIPNQPYPVSLTEEEGILLHALIKQFGLSNGYEIATAFGYSSSYIGLALTGQLYSLDCYVEESEGQMDYSFQRMVMETEKSRARVAAGDYPKGLSIARAMAAATGWIDRSSFVVGLSPNHVAELFPMGVKIDFAFIDGGHFDDQPTKDVAAIIPFLSEKAIVAFHDSRGNPSVANAIEHCRTVVGGGLVDFYTRHGISIVTKGIRSDEIEGFSRFLFREKMPLKRLYFGIAGKLGIKA